MFFKKGKQKIGGIVKWFPREVVFSRHPATIKDLAEEIAHMSTASPGDVYLVLACLPRVMAQFMSESRPVHIEGLGSFYFKLSCAGRGVDSPVHPRPVPARTPRQREVHAPADDGGRQPHFLGGRSGRWESRRDHSLRRIVLW